MKWLKTKIVPIVCSLFLLFLLSQMDSISSGLTYIIEQKKATPNEEISEYKNENEFLFVKNTDDFSPLSKGDLKNIIYTIVNSGWDSFTFYCPSEYKSCVTDMNDLSRDKILLTHINNYVHPYLSFSNIRTIFSKSGEITIFVERLYQEDQILAIEEKINSYLKEHPLQENMYDNIKNFHDYIINHTKYDITRNDEGNSIYQSYIAYGPLIEGYATCNGYTDVMAIFLSKLGIINYKISTISTETTGHVWNAVYFNNQWLHLDLTWDDPVSLDGTDYLQHKYFLVTNEELKKADEGEVEVLEHLYEKKIYLEFQEP